MKFHLNKADGHVINACIADSVVVDGESHVRSIIVSPTQLVVDWAASAETLTVAHLEEVAALAEVGTVVLLGMGEAQPQLLPEWHIPFAKRQVALEVMSLRAACRTYNILHGDGRGVLAALVLGQGDPHTR